MRYLLAILICWQVSAATYYVSTTGNDSNSSAQAQNPGTPWRTIQKAADNVNPGDTVSVAAGTYDRATLTRSGTAGSRITFQGTRGSSGEWLTIIDPSVAITGWSLATEVAANVYKVASPFPSARRPGVLTADGQLVEHLPFYGTRAVTNVNSPSSTWVWLTAANNATFNPNNLGWTTDQLRWGGRWACWAWWNGVIYLRFQDNSNPSSHTIRISDNLVNSSGVTPEQNSTIPSAVRLDGASYTTIQNFKVQGARMGIGLDSNSSHNIIQSNYVQHGRSQILIRPSTARSCIFNTIQHNFLTPNYFAPPEFVPGAWHASDQSTYPSYAWYAFNKNYYGETVNSPSINLINSGSSNSIVANVITNFNDGLHLHGSGSVSTPIVGNVIASNLFYNSPSNPIYIPPGDHHTHVAFNQFINPSKAIRLQYVNDHTKQSSQRTRYIYGNTMQSQNSLGRMFEWHGESGGTFTNYIWYIYHNSQSGGNMFGTINANVTDMNGVLIYNNIISPHVKGSPFTNPLFNEIPSTVRGSTKFGAFDYNWVRITSSQAGNYAWWGPNNVISPSTLQWTVGSENGFFLADNSGALAMGLDVSGNHTLRGIVHSARPGFAAGYFDPEPAPWVGAMPRATPGSVEMYMSVSADGQSAFESGLVPQTFTITRTESTAGAIAIPYTMTGTAVSGVNYTAPSGVANMADGVATAQVTIEPLADGTFTGNLTVTLTINASEDYTRKQPFAATIIIVDQDTPPGTSLRAQPQPGQSRGGRKIR